MATPAQPPVLTVFQITRQNQIMRRTLTEAAEQFAFYADQHLAKDPPDEEKAKTNREWSERCLVALTGDV